MDLSGQLLARACVVYVHTHQHIMQFVYRRAAEVLDRLQGREGSLKSIIFNKGSKETVTFRKKVYAVAAETLKCEYAIL